MQPKSVKLIIVVFSQLKNLDLIMRHANRYKFCREFCEDSEYIHTVGGFAGVDRFKSQGDAGG
jgi:hypothetical protein